MKKNCLIGIMLLISGTIYAQAIRTFQNPAMGHINAVVFSPDGRSFISGCNDHTIIQWDLASGTPIRTLQSKEGHTGPVHGLAYSNDGRYIVAGSHSTTLYDAYTGKVIRKFEHSHAGGIKAVAFSPDGKHIASSSRDGYHAIMLWVTETGQPLQELEGHTANVNAITYSSDNRMIASASHDHSIRLWGVISPSRFGEIGNFYEEAEGVHSISFSPDSKYIAGGYGNHTVAIWDIKQERIVNVMRGHTGHVHAVAFSPEGSFFATGSNDNTIILWETQTGKMIKQLTGHSSSIHAICFSSDGNYLLSGSKDKTVKLWDCSDVNLSYVYRKEIAAEQSANAKLFAPKDEFESIAEYNQRMQNANAYKASYIQKLKENYPILRKQKIANSYKSVALKIQNIGSYNAEDKTLPVTIYNETENITMSGPEARSFKENMGTVQVKAATQLLDNAIQMDLFNIEITHPTTGAIYKFGKQKTPLYMDEQINVEKTGDAGVPVLSAALRFQDKNGDNTLEGEEAGKILVVLVNEGKGTAKNIKVNLATDNASVTYDKNQSILTLGPSQTMSVTFNVRANANITEGDINFTVSFSEEKGFQPSPQALSIGSKAPLTPVLSYLETTVAEVQGNKNNMIDKNETIEATIVIKNTGPISAKEVQASVKIDDPNVVPINQAALYQTLGLIKAGETRMVKFTFSVNNNYTGANQLPVRVNISEGTGKTGGIFPLGLELKKTYAGMSKNSNAPANKPAAIAYSEVDENLPVSKNSNPDAIAVVIGNSKYLKAKSVDYAVNDARSMKNYLINVLGYKEGNIIYVENATYSDFKILFGERGNAQGKLYNTIKPGKSDVVIFYSGHGAPGLKDQKGYFVPVECDPEYVELSGYPTDIFYENLDKLQAKSVTVILDACFSGVNIYENISPVVIKTQAANVKNGLLLCSSASNEVSCWYNEKEHGLFTYFFLKAIHNKNADANKDNQLTFNEIFQYVSDNTGGVPYEARRLHGVSQVPAIQGVGKEKVFVVY